MGFATRMDMSTDTLQDKPSQNCGFNTRKSASLCILGVLVCVAIIVASIAVIFVVHNLSSDNDEEVSTVPSTPDPSRIVWPDVPPTTGEQKYRYASIACPDQNCTRIGVRVLAEGGSAVDAAISVSLCLGVTRPLSSGIGGGGFMIFYNRSSEESHVLDYRETAGAMANATMYENSTLNNYYGGGAIATPGDVAGLWMAHQRFGRLKWSRLFEHSISLLENGITLNEYVGEKLSLFYKEFDDELKAVYTNEDGTMKTAGDTVVMEKLAETYRRIAQEGKDTFYNGSLKDDIAADLSDIGDQVITADDLVNFKVTERAPIVGKLGNGNYTMISVPPPSGGAVLQYIMKILDGYNFDNQSINPARSESTGTVTTFHRIIEAWKFAYAQRANLGDDSFINNTETLGKMVDSVYVDSIRGKITDEMTHDLLYYGLITDGRLTTGTSQVSLVAGNGDAVSMTTSVNSGFGAKVMGKRTGIIFNDLMGDFSLPNQPSWTDDAWTAPSNQNNWIEPGKKPLSAMSPTIVLDGSGDVRLVTGGSGGSKIITAAAMTMINNLWFDMGLPRAVSTPRLHHQLLPNNVFFDPGFPQEYLDELSKLGHNVTKIINPPVSDSVSREDNSVYGVGDYRRRGASDGF